MLTVHKPGFKVLRTVHIFAELLCSNVPPAISRAGGLGSALAPINIHKFQCVQKIKAKLFKVRFRKMGERKRRQVCYGITSRPFY